jgi:DNA-binding CsgD family transcriptional regulator
MQVELELIDLMYDAVAEPARWQKVLDRFVEATNCISGALTLGDPRFDDYAFVCLYGVTDAEGQLLQRCSDSDGFALRIGDMPEGHVALSHEIWPEDEMLQSVAYREFYGPGNRYYGFGGIILRTATSMSLITAIREKEKGPCGEPELSLLRVLLPHLRRAALLHGELTSLRSQRAAMLGQMDQLSHAFLLIDGEKRVSYANAPARRIAEGPDGVRIERGFLRAESAGDEDMLKKSVERLAKDRGAPLHRLSIARSSGKSPYRLLLMPLPSSGTAPFGIALPEVAVLTFDTEFPHAPDPAGLQEWFGLTPAEARVADLLARGMSVDEIAGELGVSVETVRTHVRRTLSKTSTKRQGELISLILRTLPGRRL